MLFRYCLSDFEMVSFAHIVSGIIIIIIIIILLLLLRITNSIQYGCSGADPFGRAV